MSPRSWARLALVAVLALVVQVSVLDQVFVAGAHPDVMIVLVAAAGVVGGSTPGGVVGFVLGLVADLVLPTPFGLSALAYVLVGFGVGLVRTLPGDRDGRATQAAAVVAASAVGTVVYGAIGELVGQSGFLGAQTVYAMLVVTVGSVVLAVPAVSAMRFVLQTSARSSPRAVPLGGSAAR